MARTYLTRTSTSTGNRKIGTLSMWVKRGKEVEEVPFGWGSDNQILLLLYLMDLIK